MVLHATSHVPGHLSDIVFSGLGEAFGTQASSSSPGQCVQFALSYRGGVLAPGRGSSCNPCIVSLIFFPSSVLKLFMSYLFSVLQTVFLPRTDRGLRFSV